MHIANVNDFVFLGHSAEISNISTHKNSHLKLNGTFTINEALAVVQNYQRVAHGINIQDYELGMYFIHT